MSLLKSMNIPAKVKSRIVRECDATSAGDIAGAAGGLTMGADTMIKRINDSSINKSVKKTTKKTKKTLGEALTAAFVPPVDVGFVAPKRLNLKAAFNAIKESDDSTFDNTEVIAKLKGLENKEKTDARDTVTFGVENDEGGVVRVTVRAEQAADFEKALQSIMAEMDEDEASKSEVAEVLYKLKDHFDIVDVIWPDVAEDEEVGDQQFGINGEPGAEGGDLGAEGEFDLGADEPGADLGGDASADESDVKGLLAQVIDMMTADAGARKADAEARIADAKAREQELGAKASLAKIRQEEQFLDMEDQTKKQKEQEKEAKRLAQLSKWKHDMSSDGDVDATADDEGEMGLPSGNNYNQQGGDEFENQEVSRSVRRPNVMSAHDLARNILGGR